MPVQHKQIDPATTPEQFQQRQQQDHAQGAGSAAGDDSVELLVDQSRLAALHMCQTLQNQLQQGNNVHKAQQIADLPAAPPFPAAHPAAHPQVAPAATAQPQVITGATAQPQAATVTAQPQAAIATAQPQVAAVTPPPPPPPPPPLTKVDIVNGEDDKDVVLKCWRKGCHSGRSEASVGGIGGLSRAKCRRRVCIEGLVGIVPGQVRAC